MKIIYKKKQIIVSNVTESPDEHQCNEINVIALIIVKNYPIHIFCWSLKIYSVLNSDKNFNYHPTIQFQTYLPPIKYQKHGLHFPSKK